MATKAKAGKQQSGSFGFLQGQAGNVAEAQAEQYPALQWYNGKPSLKGALGKDHPAVTGGFFVKTSQVGDDFPVGEPMEYTYENGETAEVYAIGAAQIAVLAARVDWFKGDYQNPQWLDRYEKGGEGDDKVKGRNRFLVLLKGAEKWHADNGPLMISIKGVNGLILNRGYRSFMSEIHKVAENLSGQRLDVYTFVLNVEAGPQEDASKVKGRGSKITPPVVLRTIDGVKFTKTDPSKFIEASFSGPAIMELGAKFWEDAQAWVGEKASGGFDADNAIEAPTSGSDSDSFEIGDEQD